MKNPLVPLRDEDSVLSRNERDFLLRPVKDAKYYLRTDGRGCNELRSPLQFHWHRGETAASCRVEWGKTQVIAAVSAELAAPLYPDRPNEGNVTLTADVSSSAGTNFRPVAPLMTSRTSSTSAGQSHVLMNPDDDQKTLTHRLLTTTEAVLLKSGALDLESLCVVPGSSVWNLTVNMTVLDASGGNVLDASVLSCLAALRHYRQAQTSVQQAAPDSDSNNGAPPQVSILSSTTHEPTPLPLHFTPLCVSLAILMVPPGTGTASSSLVPLFLVDPTAHEERVLSGVVTVGMNVHQEVCWLDYGSAPSWSNSAAPLELQPRQLQQACRMAGDCVPSLCRLLETSLQQADQQAIQERLTMLQQQKPKEQPVPAVPFFASVDSPTLDLMEVTDQSITANKSTSAVEEEAEEAYRQQALEYNQGHVTHQGGDRQQPGRRRRDEQQANSLLRAMLQSVQGAGGAAKSGETRPESKTSQDVKDAASPMQVEAAPSRHAPTPKEKAPAKAAASTAATTAMNVDSDEEATTMQLQSEFQTVVPASSTAKSSSSKPAKEQAAVDQAADNDDEVGDLAAAIKKKKKKSKKSKSK